MEIFNDHEYIKNTKEAKVETICSRIVMTVESQVKARRHRSHKSLETPGSGQSLLMQVSNKLSVWVFWKIWRKRISR